MLSILHAGKTIIIAVLVKYDILYISSYQYEYKGAHMGEEKRQISVGQFKDMIDLLAPCMDDYLYVFDIKNDIYCISPNALERFVIPSGQFSEVTRTLQQFIHPDDFAMVNDDIARIMRKEKAFHNLQYRWLDRSGKAIWINCRGRVLFGEDGEPEILAGCINEIGMKQKADNVSGLLGESSLKSEVKTHYDKDVKGFMLRLGIDDFKEINENMGMKYGDMILHKTAECIASVTAPGQKLYKIVADEFVVVDVSGGDAEDAKTLYKRIRKAIDSFIETNGYEVFFTLSAGILEFDKIENHTYYNMMKWSEFALNAAKNSGKNKCCLYDGEAYDTFLRRRSLVHKMRRAVNNDFEGFTAYYQPIVDIRKGQLASAETLLRFCTEEFGMVSPVEFIPLLEESGLIIPVGRWVLRQAMAACSEIRKTLPDFRISVNLSYIQVLKSNVLAEILAGMEEYRLQAGSIVIELTESGFLEADDNFISFCAGLRENGILLALDDFGTGYSNFHYLYNLSPNTIKIDRSFTLKALNNDYEFNLLQHMVDMTHDIDLKLCIEGIETKQELERINRIGPDYIQGYYFGKPCAFEQFLEAHISKS